MIPKPSSPEEPQNFNYAVRNTWKFDWSEFAAKRALRCIPAVAAPLILGLIFKRPIDGLLGAAGAFAVGFGAFQELYRSKVAPMLVASVGISLSAVVGTQAAHSDIGLILATGLWAFICGLTVAIGPGATYIATQCVVFLLIATGFPEGFRSAATLSLIVFAGGLLQTICVSTIRAVIGPSRLREDYKFSSIRPSRGVRHTFIVLRRNANRRTKAYQHAVRLGLTLAATVALGRLFHDRHSYWMPMTAVIILQPEFHQTITKALSRVGGTVLGAGLATFIAAATRPSPVELVIGVILFAWLSYSFLRVNYAFFSIAITSYIVFLVSTVGLPAMAAATTRVGFTALGATIALLAYASRPLQHREQAGAVRNYGA